VGDLLATIFTLAFATQVLRITVPYAMAALGGVVCERSGVINIALEGKLLAGAFAAALVSYESGSVALGVAAGIGAGMLVAGLYAIAVVRFHADQIVAGVAINMLMYGLTRYLLKIAFGSTANSPTTPGIGGDVLETWVFWLVVAVAIVVYVAIAKTAAGLRLRAVGEHPEAADTLGVSVPRIRYTAVIVAGGLAGLGGAWLALSNHGFVAEMSNGRGYIALAAVIMGRWRPQWAVAACLLFGFAEALQLNMQASAIGVPGELAQMFPYVLTMIVLAGFMGRARPPAALGTPYESR
jgi:simple sugar transport system permease protein